MSAKKEVKSADVAELARVIRRFCVEECWADQEHAEWEADHCTARDCLLWRYRLLGREE